MRRVKRHGAGPGPRVRAPAGVSIKWEGVAYKVDFASVRAESAERCVGPGLRALQAYRWMAGNLGLANNRRQRRQPGATAEALERAAESTAVARRAYVAADWDEFERQLERHQWALSEARVAYMVPFAQIGQKVKGGSQSREKDRDRADFQRIAGELKDTGLDRAAALAHPSLKPYLREYSERSKVWLRDIYPMPRGRPPKKK